MSKHPPAHSFRRWQKMVASRGLISLRKRAQYVCQLFELVFLNGDRKHIVPALQDMDEHALALKPLLSFSETDSKEDLAAYLL